MKTLNTRIAVSAVFLAAGACLRAAEANPAAANPPAVPVIIPAGVVPAAPVIIPAGIVPGAPAAAAPAVGSPKIQFESLVYDFGKVSGGAAVKHDFIFTNTGDAELVISGVAPSCGCTTAGEWTKSVAPGNTGIIPLQFNSGQFSGQITKTATITSNDKGQPTVVLQIKGTIWKPIDVNPQFAFIQANAESVSSASVTVQIVNNETNALWLHSPESNNKLFAPQIVTNEAGKSYGLLIKADPSAGLANVQGAVTVKTSATNTPTLSVNASLMMHPSVMTTPDRVMLPEGPLTNSYSVKVAIRSQLSRPLALKDPSIGSSGVEIKSEEREPSRLFEYTLTFPAGFKADPSTPVEFRVNSNYPEIQTIRVPITQGVRPAQPASFPPTAGGQAAATIPLLLPNPTPLSGK